MNSSSIDTYQDEITLKQLILQGQAYFRELIKSWKVIGAFIFFVLAVFMYSHFTHIPVYPAKVKFLVEGQGGSNVGVLGGLLGNFGLGRSSNKANPYKILEVAKSKAFISDLLLDSIGSESDCIANRIIVIYNLDEKWAEADPEMKDFRFEHHNVDSFSRHERKVLQSLVGKMVGGENSADNALVRIDLDQETGIFSITCKTKDEFLTLDISNQLYDRLKFFFEEQILEEQIKSRNILKNRVDSIESVLNVKLKEIAKFEDYSRGMISRQYEVPKRKLVAEVTALNAANVELQKSLQLADIELQSSKPIFIAIDRPMSPINPTLSSLVMNLLMGILLGGVIGAIYVVGRKLYRDTMKGSH